MSIITINIVKLGIVQEITLLDISSGGVITVSDTGFSSAFSNSFS